MSATAQERLKSGNLEEALSVLTETVRDNPADANSRIFMFQLLAAMGNWERALTQLNVAAEMDSGAQLMAQTCRELINCEHFRESVFKGERTPLVFGEPEQWVATLIQSLGPAAAGQGEDAAGLAAAAFEKAAPIAGSIDGEKFSWMADADMRLGPATEVIVNGKYYWVAFQNIAEISIQEPVDLRDLVWLPAEFKWKNGGESVAFIPARYPINTRDDQLLLARKTVWNDLGGDFFVGEGQRLLSTDKGEYPLLEVRHIVFDHPDNEA